MGMAANKGLLSWIIERLEIGGFLENTNRRPQKNASLCEQALWEKNSKEREGNGGGGGQAFSLFPLPSAPLDQKPVHRLQKRSKTHTSKFITGVPTLPFCRFFELFYRKLTMHVDNAKKIYVKQN